MSKLIVVTGLPGSGKTFHLPRIKKEHDAQFLRDSFKKNAFFHQSAVTSSRHYVDMVCELRAGRNCVISDCEFCKKEVRKELTEVVTYHVPNVEIVWICFENNPEQCCKNVISSQREVKGRLPRIDTYTKVYS